MANGPKPHRGLLDIIGEKELELSDIRHATERALEEDERRNHLRHRQLRSDFDHNLNLLFQKDRMIQSLQTQLMDKKNQYEASLKDSEGKTEQIIKQKIGHIQSALEEEWHMHIRRNEEEQRTRLEVQYQDKLLLSQTSLNTAHQNSTLNKLSNQEEELWINFNKMLKGEQSRHKKLEKELREKIITKNRECASIKSTFEDKWDDKESELKQKLITKFELKIHKLREEAEHSQKESRNKIVELIDEQRRLISRSACFDHEIQESHEANIELNSKVQDLIGVIESAERGFLTKVQDFLDAEATAKNCIRLKCDNIISLQNELSRQSARHTDTTIQLKNKWCDEKAKFRTDIAKLKRELKDMRLVKTSEELAKCMKGDKTKLKSEIDSLNNECLELKDNLKCLQQRLDLNLESMPVLEKKNSELMGCIIEHSGTIQRKDAIICQLNDQILGDRCSFEDIKQRMSNESDTIMKEKEDYMSEVLELKNSLENLQLKLVQTREESGISSIVESRKLNELTHSLQQSQLENNRLKETVALMRKEMEVLSIRPQQSPIQTTPQSSSKIHNDNKSISQLKELRSQLDQVLREGKRAAKNDYKDLLKYNIEDFSIFKNSLQDLNSVVECLRDENMR